MEIYYVPWDYIMIFIQYRELLIEETGAEFMITINICFKVFINLIMDAMYVLQMEPKLFMITSLEYIALLLYS